MNAETTCTARHRATPFTSAFRIKERDFPSSRASGEYFVSHSKQLRVLSIGSCFSSIAANSHVR
ncbi:hypothetical protein ACLKA7_007663 [Drosophila subpalustris]